MQDLLLVIDWKASPEIVSIGPITLRWYGLLFATGFLLGLMIVTRMFKAEKAPEEWLDKIFIYMIVGAVLGARLGHVFFYEWDYYSENLVEIPMVWRGGLASHGGAIGIITALFLYSKKHKESFLWIMDRVVYPSILTASLVRFANFMNSEIIGEPTNVSWAVHFVNAGEGLDDVPRHPTQLYECVCYVILFIILHFFYKKFSLKYPDGMMLGIFMAYVFTARFCIEFVKVNFEEYNNALPINTAQTLSLPFIIFGVSLIVYCLKKKQKAPEEETSNES